jgi:hypothetical protein
MIWPVRLRMPGLILGLTAIMAGGAMGALMVVLLTLIGLAIGTLP